jgi:hypothetical protein
MSFPTVYEGLRAQTREAIASIAPAWRSANYMAMFHLRSLERCAHI